MIENVNWEEFTSRLRWAPGEHLTAVAPTGAGKTTLFSELMAYRKYNIMFGTKPADDTYDKILRQGYKRIESVQEIRSYHHKYLLWPKYEKTIKGTRIKQREVFQEAMDMIVNQKAWTTWIDESKYMAEGLKLKDDLTFMLEQLRSIKATVISGAQRPAFLPVSALSSATHIFFWKTTHDDDKKRLSDIGGINAKEIGGLLDTLGKHEFLYIKTRGTESKVLRSQVGRR